MYESNRQQSNAASTSGRSGRLFAGWLRHAAALALVLTAGLFSASASATVVFDNYQALSNVAPNPPTPNYQNFQPNTDPNKSADQLQNLITLATGYNGASSGTAANIDWAQTTHTLCDSTVANFATAVPSCAAWIDGRVTYAVVKFATAGTYTFAVAHDDEVQVDFASQFTAANAANYRTFNYNVPVGALTAYTTNDTTFANLPGNFQISQANSCYVMRIYWNNQAGLNDLHLEWTTPGATAAVIVPAASLLDPSLPASYTGCANLATDLGISKTGPTTFTPGTDVTYTITVWNYGPGAATSANFSDTLPASLTPKSFICTKTGAAVCGTITNNGNAYAVTTGALPVNTTQTSAATPPTSGDFLTYTVVATPSDVASIVNTATITNNDNNAANDTSTVTSTAASHNNTLTKVWTGATAGNKVSLNITGTGVTNAVAGTSTAPNTTTAATASATVGTTLNLVEAFTAGTAAQYATTLACVKKTDGTAVAVTGTGLSRSITEPTDSGVTCTYTNKLAANVAVTKTGPTTALMGSSYNYTLAVTNNGGVATAANVIVRDQLPAGVAATGSSNNATCTPLNSAGALVTCTIANAIAAAATTNVTLTVTAPTTAGVITNYAATNPAGTGNPTSAPSATCDTTTTSCSSAATTIPASVLTLTKTHTGNFAVGANGVYTLTVSNSNAAGTAQTTGTVTVTDTLPNGLTFVSGTGTGWTCNATGQVVTCTSTTAIAAGASSTAITLTVGVAAAAAPSTTNTATVSGGGDASCPATARCTASDPTLVSNVTVTKTGPAAATTGSSYNYTLAVNNAGGAATGTNVVVRDQLPAGEQATASTGATCTPLNTLAALLTCTIPGPIAVGGTASITLTVTAPILPGSVTNYAATNPAGTGNPASAPGNNCDTTTTSCSSVATTISVPPVLNLTKTHTGNFTVGTNGTYTLTASNSGAAATTGTVTVTDTLPTGLSFVSGTGTGWTCSAAGQVVTCTSTTAIAAGASGTPITLTVGVAAAASPSVTNTATTSGGGDATCPAAAHCAASNATTVNTAAAVTVVKTGPATIAMGAAYNYTLTVNNTGGTATAANVVVQDQLPAGVQATGATNATCTPLNSAAALVTCTIPTAIAAAGNTAVTLAVTAPTTGGSITNYAATSPTGTGNPATAPGTACNTTTTSCSSAATTVQAPVLNLTKTHTGNFTVGTNGTYTLTASNSGNLTTSGTVTVTDTLPTGLSFVSGTGTGWTCSATGQTVTCTSTTAIAAAASGSPITLVVGVAAAASPSVTNTATTSGGGDATCATPTSGAAHCAASNATTVITAAAVTVVKTGPATIAMGAAYNYTLTVNNTGGTATAANVVVQDQLPAGVQATGATNATCTPLNSAAALVTCTIPTAIAAAGNTVVTLAVTAPTTGGSITNYAATSPTGTGNPATAPGTACNTATTSCSSAATTVQAPVLNLTKTHTGNFTAGTNGTYTLTASNSGNLTTSGTVTVTDTLPTGLSFVSGTGTGWTCSASGQTVTCTSTTAIAANASGSPISLVVGVASAAVPSVTNTASASGGGDTSCPAATHCGASDATTVGGTASFTITPTGTEADTNGDGTTGDAGDTITYTYSAKNTGTVALTNVVVSDPLLPQLSCTIPTLAVGATATCAATNNVYTITATDVTNKSVSNAVTATASAPTGVTAPPTETGTATNPTVATPTTSVTVSQTGTVADTNGDGVTGDAGDVITYAFTADNTGTVALTNVTVTDSVLPNLSCVIPSLAAGASASCTATKNTYTITSQDVTNGQVTSKATVTGTPPGSLTPPTNTNTITTTTAATPVASFTITPTGTEADTNGDGTTGDAGDTITYTYSAKNTGTVALTNVVVSDPLLPQLSCTIPTLAVGATATCAATNNVYTITATDVTNKSVSNAVTATASAPTGVTAPPTETGTATNPTVATPTASFTVQPTGTVADTNGDGTTGDAGDVITYTFSATNTGTVPLTNVVVTDPSLPNLTCTIPTLAVGATATCAATNNTYTITAADVTNGSVTSTASAKATAPTGVTPPPTETGTTSNPTASTPVASFSVTPTATVADTNGDGTTGDAGDVITYTYSVKNTGTVALTNVVVTDPLVPNLTCTVPTLAVGATATCAATNNTYTITAADVTKGEVNETASGKATAPTGVTPPPTETGTTTTKTSATPVASFTVTPTGTEADTNGDGTTGDAGDAITYTFSATNTGTVALTNVVVTDPLLPNLTCTIPTLAVGATATCAATNNTYTITAADVTNGSVNSTASAKATAPTGVTPPPTETGTSTNKTAATPVASFTVTPTGTVADTNGDGTMGDAGDVITYTFSATNTGTVPLTNVVVTDPLLPNLTCTIPTLAVGATATCAATNNTYTITAADVTKGSVSNPVTAKATAPTGVTPPPTENGTTSNPTSATPMASFTVTPAAAVADTNGDGVTGDAGDVITYTYSVKNTGTALLTNIVVTDPLVPNLTCTIASLTAGTTATCAATNNTYTITAADVAKGEVDETASGKANAPTGVTPPPTETGTTTTKTSATPVASFTVTPTGTEADTNGDGVTGDAGDVITYTFSAKNTGTVPLTNVVVTDPLLPNLSCTIPTLAVGATATCAATNNTYTITAADVTNGSVNSTASAKATAPTGVTPPPTETGTSTNKTAGTPVASFSVKPTGTVADTNGDGTTGDAGDVITYTFSATNTGTVPLTNVVVTDPLLPNLTCTIPTLAVGATATCAATNNTYTITAADVTNGSVTSTASAKATAPTGVTPPPTETGTSTNKTAGTPVAKFTVTPTGTVADTNGDGTVGDAGDVITYTFSATNTGTVPLTNVVVTDPLLPNLTCTIPSLAVGATATCAATNNTYTITPTDVTNGSVTSTASAKATAPTGVTPPPTATATSTTKTAGTPVAKFTVTPVGTVADTNGDGTVGDAGDVITYTFSATNTGTVPLTNVVVTDPLLPNLSCTIPTLAVGATAMCAATNNTYTITAQDVTNGSVNSTASAKATPPAGVTPPPTETATSTTKTAVTPKASFTVTPTGTVADTNGDGTVGDAGDVITVTVSVTNTGTVPLTNVVVTDPLLPNLSCTIPTLAVGATATCPATNNTYTITPADATAGHVINNVSATGSSPGNTALAKVNASFSTPTKVGTAVITLTMQAAQREVNVGDLERYTVVATATGGAAERNITIINTLPAGFTYVQGSFSIQDADSSGTLSGTGPLRITGINIPANGQVTITYFLRVGAGVSQGTHTNQAVADDSAGRTLSNVASAEVELTSDSLLDDSLIVGTVFDDRDGDGWQDPAKATNVHVQGGFLQDAYDANSTTVDSGNGPKPAADHSAPMLHGLSLGTINGRSSSADSAERHQVVISQRLHDLRFTDDFVLTTSEGTTLHMNAAGQTTVERKGDARKGLTGQDISVERRVSQIDSGYQVDYIIRDNGIDERGIPGVRVVSVEGLVMETDAYGRFHLTGIDGGSTRGRNFILKVDPSTLPPGSVFTTENPRVIRITPGVPADFNFGVKLPEGDIEGGQVEKDIALGEVLFAAGSAEVKLAYAPMLDTLADKVHQYGGGSVTITANAAQEDLAFARAHAVQAALDKRLDPATRSRLTVNVVANGDPSPLVSLDKGIHIGTLLFDTDQATIRPAYKPLVAAIAKALNAQGGGVLSLVGRADHRGADAYNTQLGLKRAKAVYDAIAADLKPEVREKVRVEVSDNPNAPLGVDKR